MARVPTDDLDSGKCSFGKPHSFSSLWHKAAAEFLGTYILIFIGCGSAFIDKRNNITIVGIAMAWSVVATAVVYTLGHISGAHVNPAVTIAFATSLPQLLGATFASVILRALFSGDNPSVMLTLPNSSKNELNVFAWEVIISFILMLVICGAASDHRDAKDLAGVAIGGAFFINVLIAGKVTGASMNPARSIGPAIAANKYDKMWIYILAPIVGTVAASAVYDLLRVAEEPEKKNMTGSNETSDFDDRSNKIFAGP